MHTNVTLAPVESGLGESLDEEFGHIVERPQFVLAPGESVPLVGIYVVTYLDAATAQARHDLVALGLNDPWVLCTLDDEQRRADRVGVRNRRAFQQEIRLGIGIADPGCHH